MSEWLVEKQLEQMSKYQEEIKLLQEQKKTLFRALRAAANFVPENYLKKSVIPDALKIPE